MIYFLLNLSMVKNNKKTKTKKEEKNIKKENETIKEDLCCGKKITHCHPMIGTCCSDCFYQYNNNL